MKRKGKVLVSVLLTMVLSFGVTVTALAASSSGYVGTAPYGFGCTAYALGAIATSSVEQGGYVTVYAAYYVENKTTGKVKFDGSASNSATGATGVGFSAPSNYQSSYIQSSHSASYGKDSATAGLSDSYSYTK